MAKSRVSTAIKRVLSKATGRPKPNTVNPTLTKSRRYDKGGKLKTSNK